MWRKASNPTNASFVFAQSSAFLLASAIHFVTTLRQDSASKNLGNSLTVFWGTWSCLGLTSMHDDAADVSRLSSCTCICWSCKKFGRGFSELWVRTRRFNTNQCIRTRLGSCREFRECWKMKLVPWKFLLCRRWYLAESACLPPDWPDTSTPGVVP